MRPPTYAHDESCSWMVGLSLVNPNQRDHSDPNHSLMGLHGRVSCSPSCCTSVLLPPHLYFQLMETLVRLTADCQPEKSLLMRV